MKENILTRVKMISWILVLVLAGASFGLAATPTPTVTPSPTPLIPTPTPSPTPDISVMVARIKAAKASLRAFTIFMNDGTNVMVPNANYIAYNPSGKFTWIYVFSGDDTATSIPVTMITKLVLVNTYPWDGN